MSYDQITGVLKYTQDRTTLVLIVMDLKMSTQFMDLIKFEFTSDPAAGGSNNIIPSTGTTLSIDSGFTGNSVTINTVTYNLGQEFTSGISFPESQKYSGNIIYVDNRPSVTRSKPPKRRCESHLTVLIRNHATGN